MQEDISKPHEQPQNLTNSVPVAPAPNQPQTQPQPAPVMDIKKPDVHPAKPEEAKKEPEVKEPKKKKEKSNSNVGVILFACLVCASLVGLAIYSQMFKSKVKNTTDTTQQTN